MPILLHLDSSPLASSVSRELTREFVHTWKAAHPGGTVVYRDLAQNAPQPIDGAWIGAVYTPAAARAPEQVATLAVSDKLVDELIAADEYVIGVAMHNFSIPSTLKLWIDQISRVGRTFSYGSEGPKGLLTGKKATILVATGGSYETGSPYEAYNFTEPYLRAVFSFLGVTELAFITAGGTQKLMSGSVDRTEFLAPTLEKVRSLAA